MKNTKFDILGSQLTEDIFSNSIQGLLLLKKGTTIHKNHLDLFIKHEVDPSEISFHYAHSDDILKSYWSILEESKEVFPAILEKKDLGVDSLISDFSQLINSSFHEFSLLDILHTEIEKQDFIYQHSVNVGIISSLIGNILGYSLKDCHLLGQMGLFHDIGMLLVDPDIIQKEGRLTQKEYKEVQQHTILGKSALFHITQLDILISRTALLHHEKINGKGYPSKRKEKDIPFMIQIVSVADMFNSMCSTRFHQEKKSYFEAINELMNEAYGNSLNPAIVIPFTQFLMRKQLFKKVKLSNDETAEIIFIHPNEPHLPLVRLENNYIDLRKSSPLKITSLST